MTEQKATNVVWHEHTVKREEREQLLRQKGAVLWFTGLPSSGKSTIANALARRLHQEGRLCYVLDGDNVRHGLNKDLGFSPKDREENIRRISEVAALFADSGTITTTAFVSPYRKDRDSCRQLLGPDRFFEVYVKTSVETCEERDPKGLYKKARKGVIPEFTGVSAPYEAPLHPEITLDTESLNVEEEVNIILDHLREKGII
ncbi:MAG TPA: adenylyl-sulfate kinase [Candidatus Aminicenantes bacterium]|nr:adenylyl-sulfate kinase [Candidatus Aminicenantes bacterium]